MSIHDDAAKFPHNDPKVRAQLDAMQGQFMEWLTTSPIEAVQSLQGRPVEFWHEPDEAAGHFVFGVPSGVEQLGDQRRVHLTSVGATPEELGTYVVPVELVRLSPCYHPYFVHLVEASRYYQATVQGGTSMDRSMAADALAMRALAWRACKGAFDEGILGERPAAARIRIEDIRNPDLWGLTREEPEPGPLKWGGL